MLQRFHHLAAHEVFYALHNSCPPQLPICHWLYYTLFSHISIAIAVELSAKLIFEDCGQ